MAPFLSTRLPLLLQLLQALTNTVTAAPQAADAAAAPNAAAPRCPRLSGTAVTHTVQTYEIKDGATTTVTQYSYIAETVYTTGPSVAYTTAPPKTTTLDPYTTTVYTQKPAKKTVTVPTKAGFTPVSCESSYVLPTRNVTSTSTVYADRYSTVSSNETRTYYGAYTSYVTSGTTTFTYESDVYKQATKTSHITLSSATSTNYRACATNNLVSRTPNGKFIDMVTVSSNAPAPIDVVRVFAYDQVQCCGWCQGNSTTCTFSAFDVNTAPGTTNCNLFMLEDSKQCRGSSQFGTFYNYYDTLDKPSTYVSNGPCGQFDPSDVFVD